MEQENNTITEIIKQISKLDEEWSDISPKQFFAQLEKELKLKLFSLVIENLEELEDIEDEDPAALQEKIAKLTGKQWSKEQVKDLLQIIEQKELKNQVKNPQSKRVKKTIKKTRTKLEKKKEIQETELDIRTADFKRPMYNLIAHFFCVPLAIAQSGKEIIERNAILQSIVSEYHNKRPKFVNDMINGAYSLCFIKKENPFLSLSKYGKELVEKLQKEGVETVSDLSTITRTLARKGNLVKYHREIAEILYDHYQKNDYINGLISAILALEEGQQTVLDIIEFAINEDLFLLEEFIIKEGLLDSFLEYYDEHSREDILADKDLKKFFRSHFEFQLKANLRHIGILSADSIPYSGHKDGYDPSSDIWKPGPLLLK